MNRRRFLKTGIRGGLGLLAFSYPVFIERSLVRINHYQIAIPELPEAFDGFRIVHLTDLHLGFLVSESFIRGVIRKANVLTTDVIVCTGDYIHERDKTDQIDRVWPILCQLEAPLGVYSVLGNHDHWGSFERSYYWLNRSGQNVRHTAKSIVIEDKRLWIGGAGDLWEDEPGIDQAFSGVPEDEFKILLAHNPDTADLNFRTRVDLILAGHTHGGQVKFPFIGTPVLPVQNKKYTSGLIRTANSRMFISRGIGWAVYPVRLNCSPEIAVLELKCCDSFQNPTEKV